MVRKLLVAAWVVLLASTWFGFGCTEKRSPTTLPPSHPVTWLDTTSVDFHGDVVSQTGTAGCQTCHGADFDGGEVGVSCIDCHLTATSICLGCHGGTDNQSAAPPVGLRGETNTTTRAVGAHTSHIDGAGLSDGVPCAACHLVPPFIFDSLHLDLGGTGSLDSIAELVWSDIAPAPGITWNRTSNTCSDSYCHGNFGGGDTTNVPVWNASGQASCGSCHDAGSNAVELGWKHEFHVTTTGLLCADCHAGVVDTLDTIVGLNLHVNGVADTLTRDTAICAPCHGGGGGSVCIICHGGTDNTTGAPPVGLEGETATTALAVGAHSAHVEDGTVADAFDCIECHIKPDSLLQPGHLDADSIAEINWGGIAPAIGVTWIRGAATCAGSYCHGNFGGGDNANVPVWTATNQAACGSCHDIGTSPADLGWKHEFHVATTGLQCADCHASVVDLGLTITALDLHVNGVADTLTRDTAICAPCHGGGGGSVCIICHGGTDNATGAPPVGLEGETATAAVAVGAHSAHVEDGTVADAFDCIECHIKPDSLLQPGHLDADSIAEINWGGIAPAPGISWTRGSATCAGSYCHGNFNGGDNANAPIWTATNQAACGSCHDIGSAPADLGWKHEYHITDAGLLCADCHASVVDTFDVITALDLHVNGAIDTLTRDPAVCASCHGGAAPTCVYCHGGTQNLTGAPPEGLRGETASGDLAVGAHTVHVDGGSVADAFDCTECHIKPADLLDPGHYATDSVAEITWGGIAPAPGISWNRGAATCAGSYCHGNFTGGANANAPVWTAANQAACGSCHDIGTTPGSLGWKHAFHVTTAGLQCADCHAAVVDIGLNITALDLHVNGVADTLTRDTATCAPCHGSGGNICTVCHGGLDNLTGAPPVGLEGEVFRGELAVGAHTAHVSDGVLADAFDCTECHVKPDSLFQPGHLGADSVAEITWGGIAQASGTTWNRGGATCSFTYCHGNFAGGEALNAPSWFSGFVACGTCHDAGASPDRLGWKHDFHVGTAGLLCADCHASVVDTLDNIFAIDLHVNGVADTLTRDTTICANCHGGGATACTYCHGGGDNSTGAPPDGLRGETSRTDLAVGAHTVHVQGASRSVGYDCIVCHVKPFDLTDPGHLGADSIAEITWGGIAPAAGINWNRGSATCANNYCHGNFPGGYAGNTSVWTNTSQAACGSCHDVGANPDDLSGEHKKHVEGESVDCYECHAQTVDPVGAIGDRSIHANGAIEIVFSSGQGNWDGTDCTNVGCHGRESWR